MGRRTSRRGIFWTLVALAVLWTTTVEAVIPLPGRTLSAIAGVNRASGRNQALQLELKLRVGEEPPIATAELITHPSGLARLEIVGNEGRVDRYLLSGEELSGTKNGLPLLRPRPLLQPLFLLQPSSASTLRTALETFGVRTSSIGLLPCGAHDCFVLGDPRLEAPLPPPEGERSDPGFEDFDPEPLGPRASLRESLADGEPLIVDGRLPRFWVDTDELQVRRIDRADGIVVIFGPIAQFDRIKVPSWFEVHDPAETFPMRFEVERAVQVNAPPNAFDRGWLIPPDLDRPAAPDPTEGFQSP